MGIRSLNTRRTPGLRREEVCTLGSFGLSWYTWLEQGRNVRLTAETLWNIGGVLQLNADEIAYAFELAGLPRMGSPLQVTEALPARYQIMLDTLDVIPAYINNGRWDRIAWNDAAVALFGDFGTDPPRERNTIWRSFTNISRRRTMRDWSAFAQIILAEFTASRTRFLEEPWMADFISELLAASPEFREWWPKRDVQYNRDKELLLVHSKAGELRFYHTSSHLTYSEDTTLVMLTPVPGTETLEKMERLLADYRHQLDHHSGSA